MNASHIPLEVITIPEPCHADWEQMAGDAQRRFCNACGKHVHDLSKMTKSDAEALVCNSAGTLCVRIGYDAAGKTVTLDYAKPTTHRRWTFRAAVAGMIACVAATSSFVKKPPAPVRMVAGRMVAPQVGTNPVSRTGG